MTDPMILVLEDISRWSRSTFPNQTDERLLGHLGEEMDELIEAIVNGKAPEIEDGLADVVILLVSLADLHGVSLLTVTRRKHEVNTRRSWAYDPERGYDKHVDSEAQP